MTPSTTQVRVRSGSDPISRRRFIVATAAGIVAASLVAGGTPAELAHASSAVLSQRLEEMDRETFTRYVGETFQFTIPLAEPMGLQLDRVEDRSAGCGHGGECFAVVFRGPQDRLLTQNTYEVWNRRSGAFAMFVVPMRAVDGTPAYEALFNRLPA